VLLAELLPVELPLVEFPFVELLVAVLLLGSWTTVPDSLLLTMAPAIWVALLIVLLGVDTVLDPVLDPGFESKLELVDLLELSLPLLVEAVFELVLLLEF
jgi:hypothetical protein